MWKPPERIRHQPDPGPWPDADQAARSRLFQPIDVGPARLANRGWIPAMVPWRATEDGKVTEALLQWYGRFAKGRPGAIVVEATGIRDIASGPLLRIGHDRYVEGLKRLVDTVRQASGGQTRLFIQLIDFLAIRRRPERDKFLARFLAITEAHRQRLAMADADEAAIRERLIALPDDQLRDVLSAREWEDLTMGYRERVTDTHLDWIRELPETLPGLFADAAQRAREAGFDGVELHYAHAYTMASFLSRLNDRSDGYGGSLEDRLRLPLEVYRAVRDRVGANHVVGCRYLAEDCIAGGNTLADTIPIGLALARAGMDFLSLSRGGRFEDAKQPAVGQAAYPYTGPSGYECMPHVISDEKGPFGRNAPACAAIRKAIRDDGLSTPVVLAGGIHGFGQAESFLADDTADIIAIARQAIADPDWFEKLRTGRGERIRACKYTNYCEALDQKHKIVTCQRWDRLDLDEPGILKSPDGKRRLTAPD